MKRITLIAAACLMASAASADPVAGTWKTQPGDDGAYGHVTVAPCGSAICGTIAKAFNASGQEIASDNIGKPIIWDMKAKGGGAYSGGKIWAPDRDKTYNSKMSLSGNALKVEGCVLGICRDQMWSRVN